MNPFLIVGRGFFSFLEHAYLFFALGVRSFSYLRKWYFFRRQIFEQFYSVGTGSLPVILIAATFTGMVIAIQAAGQMKNTLIPLVLVGAAVLKAVLVELGPVLTALILAGRIGAGIAAEIGTMKVSEQVDALESLALEPHGFLVMPRILAGFVMLPALNIASCLISIVSSFVTVRFAMGLSMPIFVQGMRMIFHMGDIWLSTLKAFCFGGFISWVACYFGLRSEAGAKGVGKATTSSVIVSLIGILVIDYIIANIFL